MTTVEQLYGHLKTLNKQWFYDKTEIDGKLALKLDATDVPTKISDLTDDSTFIDESELNTALSNYYTKSQTDEFVDTTELNTALSDYIPKSATSGLVKNDGTIDTTTYQEAGDYIETSETVGLVKNDGTIDTNVYLTQHQDISMKANSADLHAVATSGSYTDLVNIPETFASTTAQVTSASAFDNLGTSAGATQHAINTALDTKIGSLLAVELIEVSATRPTASASTMNKLYLVPEEDTETEDAYEVFVTVEDNGSYSWEKVDTARIDLSGYALVDHVHGNITNDGKIGSTADQFVYTSTGGLVTAKSTVGNITTDGAIGSDTGKVVVTTNNGVLTTSDWVTEVDNVIQQLTTYGNSLDS